MSSLGHTASCGGGRIIAQNTQAHHHEPNKVSVQKKPAGVLGFRWWGSNKSILLLLHITHSTSSGKMRIVNVTGSVKRQQRKNKARGEKSPGVVESFWLLLFPFPGLPLLQKQRFQSGEPPRSAGLPAPTWAWKSAPQEAPGCHSALTMASEPWPPSDVGKRTSRTESLEILPRTMSPRTRSCPGLHLRSGLGARWEGQSPAPRALIGRVAAPRNLT